MQLRKDSCLAVLSNRARSGRPSIGSTYSFGEDIVTTPAVSEVDERSILGSATPFRIYHFKRESSETRSSNFRTSDVLTQQKSSRDSSVLHRRQTGIVMDYLIVDVSWWSLRANSRVRIVSVCGSRYDGFILHERHFSQCLRDTKSQS